MVVGEGSTCNHSSVHWSVLLQWGIELITFDPWAR